MGYMTAYLVEMSGKSDIKNVAQQPDVILSVRAEFQHYQIMFISMQKLLFENSFLNRDRHPVGKLLIGAATWCCQCLRTSNTEGNL